MARRVLVLLVLIVLAVLIALAIYYAGSQKHDNVSLLVGAMNIVALR